MRFVSAAVVALAVVGCAGGSSGAADPSAASPSADFSIQIEPLSSGWVVHTSRPASMAMFEIVPGRGAGLLYPDPGRDDGHLDAGSNRVVTEIGSVIARHRASYLSQRGGGGLVGSSNVDLYEANDPTVVVAIACECELDVSQLAQPDGPSEVLGHFASVNSRTAVDRLVRAVLPSGDVRWVMDRYAAGIR